MSDPKPEVRFVEGGVVSAESYPDAGQPDWEAECERLRWQVDRWERLETQRAMCCVDHEERLQRIRDARDRYQRGDMGHGALIQAVYEALDDGAQIAVKAPQFNDRPSGTGIDGTKSPDVSLTPWGGYPKCPSCDSVLTTDEFERGSHCLSCQQVVE
jgi:hypothetical protein